MEQNFRVLVLLSTIAATFAFGFNFGATDPPTTRAPITTPVPPLRQNDGELNRPDVPEPHYTFRYMVQDSRTGDYKSQEERRDGSHVRGTYSVAEPNGDLRVVSYSSDGDSGFRAEVRVEPAGAPTSQEARTFSNFFPDPTAIFRTPSYFRTPNIKANVNEKERPLPVQQVKTSPVPQNMFAGRPTQMPQNFYVNRQMGNNMLYNRPTQMPQNIYTPKATQVVPQNMFSERPIVVQQQQPQQQNSFLAERPMQVAQPTMQNMFDRPSPPVYGQQVEDMNQMSVYPYYDKQREPQTQGITPASTYQLFQKPVMVEYNKDGNFYSGYRQHLPETPAIPITPPSPLEQQTDIITGTTKSSGGLFSPNFSLFRRPTPTPKPTAVPPPRRYPSPTPYPQQPFQFMKYSPAVFAPQPQIPQQPQTQQIWMPNNSPYPGYYPNGAQPSYMLVRTYLVPMPPNGQLPANFMSMPMETMSQPMTSTTSIKTTPAKTTTMPVETETNSPAEPVTTAETSQTTV